MRKKVLDNKKIEVKSVINYNLKQATLNSLFTNDMLNVFLLLGDKVNNLSKGFKLPANINNG